MVPDVPKSPNLLPDIPNALLEEVREEDGAGEGGAVEVSPPFPICRTESCALLSGLELSDTKAWFWFQSFRIWFRILRRFWMRFWGRYGGKRRRRGGVKGRLWRCASPSPDALLLVLLLLSSLDLNDTQIWCWFRIFGSGGSGGGSGGGGEGGEGGGRLWRCVPPPSLATVDCCQRAVCATLPAWLRPRKTLRTLNQKSFLEDFVNFWH